MDAKCTAGVVISPQHLHLFGTTRQHTADGQHRCKEGHVECMRLLIEAGCNTSVVSHDGATALICAASSCNVEAVRTALACSMELEESDAHGCTALLSAASKGHASSISVLIEAGCSVQARTRKRETVLLLAVLSRSSAAVEVVLQLGGASLELEERDKNQWTALLLACMPQALAACMHVCLHTHAMQVREDMRSA